MKMTGMENPLPPSAKLLQRRAVVKWALRPIQAVTGGKGTKETVGPVARTPHSPNLGLCRFSPCGPGN